MSTTKNTCPLCDTFVENEDNICSNCHWKFIISPDCYLSNEDAEIAEYFTHQITKQSEWAKKNWNPLKDQKEQVSNQIDLLTRERDEIQSKLTKSGENLRKALSEISSYQQSNVELKTEIQKSEEEKAQLNREISRIQVQIEQLMQNSQATIYELEEKKTQLKTEKKLA